MRRFAGFYRLGQNFNDLFDDFDSGLTLQVKYGCSGDNSQFALDTCHKSPGQPTREEGMREVKISFRNIALRSTTEERTSNQLRYFHTLCAR